MDLSNFSDGFRAIILAAGDAAAQRGEAPDSLDLLAAITTQPDTSASVALEDAVVDVPAVQEAIAVLRQPVIEEEP